MTTLGLFGWRRPSYGYLPDFWFLADLSWTRWITGDRFDTRHIFPPNEFWGTSILCLLTFVVRHIYVVRLKRPSRSFWTLWYTLPFTVILWQCLLYLLSLIFPHSVSMDHQGLEPHPFWDSACPDGPDGHEERPQWNEKAHEEFAWWLDGPASFSPFASCLSLAILIYHWKELVRTGCGPLSERDVRQRDRFVVVFMLPVVFGLANLAAQVRLTQVLSGDTECGTRLENYISLVKGMLQIAILIQFFSTISIGRILYPCFPDGPRKKLLMPFAWIVVVVGMIRCLSLIVDAGATHIELNPNKTIQWLAEQFSFKITKLQLQDYVATTQWWADFFFKITNLVNNVLIVVFHWGIVLPVLNGCSYLAPFLMFLGSRLIVFISTVQHQALVPTGFKSDEWRVIPLRHWIGDCKKHHDHFNICNVIEFLRIDLDVDGYHSTMLHTRLSQYWLLLVVVINLTAFRLLCKRDLACTPLLRADVRWWCLRRFFLPQLPRKRSYDFLDTHLANPSAKDRTPQWTV